jgi:crotonobetainyl-CoA:carnitine CoA-transferase CaiB-like acyl-CoA transferase
MMLGDMGADVIKIEKPGTGDETPGWGPPFDDRGESAYYLSVNRNKKSVAADLDLYADCQFVVDLIGEADVVVDNFRRGALERRGIHPERLLEQHGRLVWCTISGFGPHSDRAGYDLIVQAESGWMSITGDPDGEPTRVGVALADIIAGKDAAIAILAALASRDSDATDRRIFISLAHSATAALINVAQNSLVTGEDATRWGNEHPNLVPYQPFHTADRTLIIAVGTDTQWIQCATALELPELANDPVLTTNAGRIAHRRKIVEVLSKRLIERPANEWLVLLTERGVPCGLVNSVLESLSLVKASPLTGIAPTVPGEVRLPPPRLNEHGAEVRQRGWSAFHP